MSLFSDLVTIFSSEVKLKHYYIMTTQEHLQKAYDNSYYTIIGCGGDLSDWREGYNELIRQMDSGFDINKEDYFFFKGSDMNRFNNLTGDNAYPEDLTFFTFSYNTCTEIKDLAMFKLRMGDRWFDDIVDNDRIREKEKGN